MECRLNPFRHEAEARGLRKGEDFTRSLPALNRGQRDANTRLVDRAESSPIEENGRTTGSGVPLWDHKPGFEEAVRERPSVGNAALLPAPRLTGFAVVHERGRSTAWPGVAEQREGGERSSLLPSKYVPKVEHRDLPEPAGLAKYIGPSVILLATAGAKRMLQDPFSGR